MTTKKMKTMSLKGNEYAGVPIRIKQFREENPRGYIKTTPTMLPDGMVSFEAYVQKDKADENSASATGHSIGLLDLKKEKTYEKLETVAIGRALAFIGYAASGDIASSEEMEEYEEFMSEKKAEAIDKLHEAKTLEELKTIFINLGSKYVNDKDVIAEKDLLKKTLK